MNIPLLISISIAVVLVAWLIDDVRTNDSLFIKTKIALYVIIMIAGSLVGAMIYWSIKLSIVIIAAAASYGL